MKENRNLNNEFAFLNLIRFFLAFCVMFMHCTGFLSVSTDTSIFLRIPHAIGQISVSGFFVISGLLFHEVYYSKLMNNKMTFKEFIMRRWMRVFPLVLITTIMLMSINAISMDINGSCLLNNLKFSDFIISVTTFGTVLFDNNFHMNGLWYLSVLFFIYFIMIAICVFYKKTRNRVFLIIPFSLGLWMTFSQYSFPFFNSKISIGLVCFSVGIYLNWFISKISNKHKTIFFFKIICFMWIVVLSSFLIKDKFNNWLTNHYWTRTSSILFYCPLFIILYNIGTKLFSKKGFKMLSSCSFDIYLWHTTIFSFFFLILTKFKITFLKSYFWFSIIILVVLCFSILSLICIDTNVAKISSFLRSRIKKLFIKKV